MAVALPTQLPDRGPLVPLLTNLAFGMQDREGGATHVRIDVDDALELLGCAHGEEVLRAGVALSVLDEDPASNEVLFVHQLVQEYFAARRFAAAPEAERVRTVWKKAAVTPSLEDVLETLPASDVQPALPTTGWEETVLLAAAMSPDADAFVRGLVETNLPLAGRCAAQSDVRPRLSDAILDDIRHALVRRSRTREADLRARIAAGFALGPLGDPRFERTEGPDGLALVPPVVQVPAGRYPIGEDEPFEYPGQTDADHVPRHDVEVSGFELARFAVTNAEWACFMAAGGYDQVRFWDTEAARRWWSGEGTADGDHQRLREGLQFLRQAPDRLDAMLAAGQITRQQYEQWKQRLAMTESELGAHIREEYPGGTFREPMFWRNEKGNNPSQPVVGVCWFEARAYCNWLSAQSGRDYRLPTEVEWEAAARGRPARRYAWGDRYDPLRGNTLETRIKQTTPVGVFVEGDTPEGVSDLTGNVFQWTNSSYGPRPGSSADIFGYPYRADDGREDPTSDAGVRRVLRGGGWGNDAINARTAFRFGLRPDYRGHYVGFRVLRVSSE